MAGNNITGLVNVTNINIDFLPLTIHRFKVIGHQEVVCLMAKAETKATRTFWIKMRGWVDALGQLIEDAFIPNM